MDEFPYVVDSFCLRDFLRAEITYEEMTEGRSNLVFDDYCAGIDDFVIAFENMSAQKYTRSRFADDWFVRVFYDLIGEFGLGKAVDRRAGVFMVYTNENEMLNLIFNWGREIDETLTDRNKGEIVDFGEILRSIKTYKENKERHADERRYTRLMKRNSIQNMGAPQNIDVFPSPRRALYKRFVNDLYKAGDIEGLKSKAISHLFGNTCFRKDASAALKIFKELYEKENDPRTASLIGDIYYGCFGSAPVFEMAYQYYVMSGLDGYADALVKVADMMFEGVGTVKNRTVAINMMRNLFDQTYGDFCKGDNQCPFTEAALQLGAFLDKIEGGKRDAAEAFKYVNIAKYALELRMAGNKMPQDEIMLATIDDLFDRLSEETGADGKATRVISEVPNLLLTAMTDGYIVHAEIKERAGENRLVTRRIKKSGEDKVKGILVDFPLLEYCALTDLVTETFPKNSKYWIKDGGKSFDAEEMIFDKERKLCIFKNKGKAVASIAAGMFVAKLRSDNKRGE